MRGCFLYRRQQYLARKAFPAYAGMFLSRLQLMSPVMAFPAYAGMFLTPKCERKISVCFPRVCGDVSVLLNSGSAVWELSPRMRGCFRVAFEADRSLEAFPAYAGMFPKHTKASFLQGRFPRVCGDVSRLFSIKRSTLKLSPRMRGCFFNLVRRGKRHDAFPAYAGMFPRGGSQSEMSGSFPRVCGDVSSALQADAGLKRLSPRMRGCF